MTFELKALPYPEDALEPAISRETVSVHYHKHHAGYVSKLNKALEKSVIKGNKGLSLEQVILNAEDQSMFNVAAQVWNHDFYWSSLNPEPSRPDTHLADALQQSFGSMAEFEEAFKQAALNEFGSGWAWLGVVKSSGHLSVISTTDAVTPIFDGFHPLLTLDVWEHAYYLDYQNDRARYIERFLSQLINWEFASAQLATSNDAFTSAA